MKSCTSLLFFVVCSISSYVSMSEASCACPETKKSLAEQCKKLRETDKALRVALFKEMKDGIKLVTIQEGTCLKKETIQNMPSFAPLYKGAHHTLSPLGKSDLSLLERTRTISTSCSDKNRSKSQLSIDESD